MKIMLERDLLRKVHDRIETLLNTMILNLAEAGVDGVMFAENWGTQSQTLVSPDLWMEEYFPHYERLCRTAHNTGVKVFMHSCGQTEAIVPGLMEAGIDVLQFDQPELHGIDNLARHQDRGRITFWCPVDIQTTLQSGNGTMIGEKAREMLDKLWKGRGGFIAGHYGDNASIGLDPKWQEIASSEFLKHGVRSNF
jgi:uroporphyrinogen decarboxylase